MIDLGKDNIFLLGDNYRNSIAQVFNYFDLEQLSYLYLGGNRSIKDMLLCKSLEYSDVSDLCDKISQNLFRLDILVIECNINHRYMLDEIREITDLPIIMISDRELYDNSICDYYYKFYKIKTPWKGIADYSSNHDEYSYIQDIKSNWTSTIKDLKLEKGRDNKLNKILNGKL